MNLVYKYIKKAAETIVDLVYPRRCPVCDGITTPFGSLICRKCIGKLKPVESPWCMKCGKKLRKEGMLCEECRKGRHSFDRGRVLFEYDSAALSIYRFKYGGRQEYAEYYGKEIAEKLGDFISSVKPDGFIPIPLHKRRLAGRGYNQAQLISKAVSKYTGIPTYSKFLIRTKNTKPMKLLSARERQNNTKNAFIIGQNSVKLSTTIIIDDIYTSGATIDEAARVLRTAGVQKVYFITLASGDAM